MGNTMEVIMDKQRSLRFYQAILSLIFVSPGAYPKGTLAITFVWSSDTSGVPGDLVATPLGYKEHGATWEMHHSYPWRNSPFPPFDAPLTDFDGKRSGKIMITVGWNNCDENADYTFKAVDESGNELKEGFQRRKEAYR
jgi:hypothetical protein